MALTRAIEPRRLACGWAAAFALLLAACATPTERFDQRATELGFAPVSLRGDPFRHRAFAAGTTADGDLLHVYIEHDGTPWLAPAQVADDPTPRTPLALELMARDTGPRLLLGRPCYYEYRNDPGCSPLLWTHQRYSPEVVASMVTALRQYLAANPYRRVMLVGYSGGGTLAWLMARQVPEAIGVVTVAANLDTDRWTALHGFSPLAGSQNPALQPALPAAIAQVNFAGGRDRNVPPSIIESFGRRHPGARVVIVDEFDHNCCWVARWPELLGSALAVETTNRAR